MSDDKNLYAIAMLVIRKELQREYLNARISNRPNMAWNKYYIFVKEPKLTDTEMILSKLKLRNYKPKEKVPLHYSNKPDTLFMGFYKGNLLIVHPDLVFHFFNDEQSETEKLFIEAFPDNEIAVLVEDSSVGLFSYAIIDRGRRIRMKDGADGEIFHDRGELLPEEKNLLSRVIFEDEEIGEMREEGMSDEEIDLRLKFEASWRVPNLITKRYLGEAVGSIDTNEIILTRYM